VILIPYITTVVIMVVGVILGFLGIDIPWLRCILTWVIHPLFIFEVILAYVLCSVILIAASANADFCSGGQEQIPDETMLEILGNLGYKKDDLVFLILVFYVGQCSSVTPFGFLDQYRAPVEEATTLAVEFSSTVSDVGTAALSEACAADVAFLQILNAAIIRNLEKLVVSTERMQELLQCSNIVRLYTDPVYDGTCTYSITGFTWAWASFAVVGAAGLIMIMLRSSWKIDVDKGESNVYAISTSNVDQGLEEELKQTEEEFTPYNPDEHGDNPFEDQTAEPDPANKEEVDAPNPQEQATSNVEGAYSAGVPNNVENTEIYAETGVLNDVPPPSLAPHF